MKKSAFQDIFEYFYEIELNTSFSKSKSRIVMFIYFTFILNILIQRCINSNLLTQNSNLENILQYGSYLFLSNLINVNFMLFFIVSISIKILIFLSSVGLILVKVKFLTFIWKIKKVRYYLSYLNFFNQTLFIFPFLEILLEEIFRTDVYYSHQLASKIIGIIFISLYFLNILIHSLFRRSPIFLKEFNQGILDKKLESVKCIIKFILFFVLKLSLIYQNTILSKILFLICGLYFYGVYFSKIRLHFYLDINLEKEFFHYFSLNFSL